MANQPPSPGPARLEAEAAPVSDIMTPTPVCVRAHLTLDKLLPLLVDENIGGVPVVDEHGCPMGMVSKTDLLAEQADRADSEAVAREFAPVGQLVLRGDIGALARHTAGELMSTPLLSVVESASVFRAAELLAGHRVHRLGVVDGLGRLVGVVSNSDVVRWLARR